MVAVVRRRWRIVASGLAAVAAVGVGSLVAPTPARAATAVDLGTAANFAVLAATTVTNTGPTVVNGYLGVSPGTAVTGFPPGVIDPPTGIHAGDSTAADAQLDLTAAYNDAVSQVVDTIIPTQLGGTTLGPGTYTSASGTFQIDGTLILDAGGDENAVFLFKTASTLVTGSGSQVVLAGDGVARNVFWQVGSSATLGTGSSFVGTILALTSITATTGVEVEGRLLARNGAVTLDSNVIAVPAAAPPPPTPTPSASAGPPFNGPPQLPVTGGGRDGGGAVPMLVTAGGAMVVLGVLTLAFFRRRTEQ